ncbi:MAG TPA: DUF3489 domain-containing protein [Rhizobiaceae bacterium]|nr:DUF3489 domain-containing protein [Rhizobiaceae bacterium]
MSYPPQVVIDPPDGADAGEPQKASRAGSSRNAAVPAQDEAASRSRGAANAKQRDGVNKTQIALKALRSKRGASLAELQELTGWQPHSVRGFLSGMVRKKLGLMLTSEVGKDDVRRYRIDDAASA